MSGIQILKVNSSEASYQGLFGHIVGGTVKNVILDKADIWGDKHVGGIAGRCDDGTISGCFVFESKIIGVGGSRGVIVGNNGSTLMNNYYHDCEVSTNSSLPTNIGFYDDANGSGLTDKEGAAEPLYTIAILSDGLSASGASVTYNSVPYFAHNTEVTLSYGGDVSAGYNAINYKVSSMNGSIDLSGLGLIDGYRFMMPAVEPCYVSVDERYLSLALLDDDSARPTGKKNADYIAAADGAAMKVALYGRRFFQDGEWNTICLPFSLSSDEINSSDLKGAELMELDEEKTSFNTATGTLSLSFKSATSIMAGTPYLIKWGEPEGATSGYLGTAIDSPRFKEVSISNNTPAIVKSADEKVSFIGIYSPVANDNTKLLHDGISSIGAFRAYIQLNGFTVNDIVNYNTPGYDGQVTLTGHLSDGIYWATFFHKTQNYQLPAGTQAFTMDSQHHLYRVGMDGRIIPANTAVVILSDQKQIQLTVTEETASTNCANILRGSNSSVNLDVNHQIESKNVYVLGIADTKLGFFKFTGDAVPANKAYYVE